MIIDVKATKASAEADASEQYTLKSMDKKSNLPLIIGAFATGIVVYVKSVFVEGAAKPVEPAAPAKPEDTGQNQDRAVKLQLVSVSEDFKTSTASSSEGLNGPGEKPTFATRFGSLSIDLVDEPPLRFLHAHTRSNWDSFQVSPVMPLPSNDNHGHGPESVRHSPDGSAGGAPQDTKAPIDFDDDGLDEDDDTDADTDTDTDANNRAPRVTGSVYLRDVVGCATMVIALNDLLRNVDDPDGDTLSIGGISVSAGTLTVSGAEWIYSGGPVGPVTVTYEVTDGQYSVQQTAYFSVLQQPPIYGDDTDNVLLGSMCSDEIDGRAGNDNIDARAGDDLVDGGAGHDHIVGGVGNDVIRGQQGDDIIFGGLGDDHISGGDGNDRLFGEEGDDIIYGDDGDDLLDGGDGNDILIGGSGNDLVRGGAGHDTIAGESGEDQLFGSAGNDRLAGNAGNDLVDGGAGDDVLLDGEGADIAHGGSGDDAVMAAIDGTSDIFDGGSGDDMISYADATQAVTIDLKAGKATGVEIGDDTISGFENVTGGESDDVFIAGSAPVTFTGNGGNNEFIFENSDQADEADSQIVLYQIVDFKPGDLIKMSKYDIFEEVVDEVKTELEEIYGEDFDEDHISVRYSKDDYGKVDKTIIEADLDDDKVYETTILLNGNHALLLVENP